MSGNHSNTTTTSVDLSVLERLFALFCIVAVIGILANLCLIITICRQHTLRSVPTYVALICQAFVDIVYLVFIIGAGTTYTYGMLNSNILCQVVIFGMYSTTGVSSYHMVIFSALRYAILVKPFFAMKHVTVKNTLSCCLLCWLVFSCFAGLAFFTTNFGEVKTSDKKFIHTCITAEGWKWVDILIFTVEFYIPLALIAGLHVAKCVHLKRRSIETANTPAQKQQVSTGIVVTIIVLYILCYLPVSIHVMVTLILEIPVTSELLSLGFTFMVLIPFNSTLNPFVYFFFTKCVRKGACRSGGTNT